MKLKQLMTEILADLLFSTSIHQGICTLVETLITSFIKMCSHSNNFNASLLFKAFIINKRINLCLPVIKFAQITVIKRMELK